MLSTQIVNVSIIGGLLRRAHQALYHGIKGPTTPLVNQHTLKCVVGRVR